MEAAAAASIPRFSHPFSLYNIESKEAKWKRRQQVTQLPILFASFHQCWKWKWKRQQVFPGLRALHCSLILKTKLKWRSKYPQVCQSSWFLHWASVHTYYISVAGSQHHGKIGVSWVQVEPPTRRAFPPHFIWLAFFHVWIEFNLIHIYLILFSSLINEGRGWRLGSRHLPTPYSRSHCNKDLKI